MEENKRTPNLVSTLIMTTIAIITWVSFSIYKAFVKPEPVVVPPEILEPLDPQLNTDTLNKMKERYLIAEDELPEITPIPKSKSESPSPSPFATPTPKNNEGFPTTTPSENINQ
jgi:hypothetical protein